MKKILTSLVSMAVGAGAGAYAVNKQLSPKLNNAQGYSNKHLALFIMMNDWVRIKQQGKNLKDYFVKNNYKNIAVYGMSYAGETLIDELKGTEICVKYGIDKNADRIYSDTEIYGVDEPLEKVDAVVVTAITFFDEIARNLEEKMDCPIISLEEVLYDMK